MRRFAVLIVMVLSGAMLYAQTIVDAQQIIETAKQYLHCPYSYGATGPDRFDCSGFVRFCFSQNGISLPRSSSVQAGEGERVADGWDNLQTGDLVFFGHAHVSHVGIYVGTPSEHQHQFIHASTSQGVTISCLEEKYWKSRFKFARRLSLVASEPIVVRHHTESDYSVTDAPQSAVGDEAAHASSAIDDVVPYKSKRWKTKINRKTRANVTYLEQ